MSVTINSVEKKGFVTLKDILSISGSGFGVWIICCVLVTLFPDVPQKYEVLILRWGALVLSFLCSYIIYRNTGFRISTKNVEKQEDERLSMIILVIINGCLIYLNAVGINCISNGTSFSKTKQKNTESNIIPFLRDISWWPDEQLIDENIFLKHYIDSLQNPHNRQMGDFMQITSLNGFENQYEDSKSVNRDTLIVINNKDQPIKNRSGYFLLEQNNGDTLINALMYTNSNGLVVYNYDSLKKYFRRPLIAPDSLFIEATIDEYLMSKRVFNPHQGSNVIRLREKSEEEIKKSDMSMSIIPIDIKPAESYIQNQQGGINIRSVDNTIDNTVK